MSRYLTLVKYNWDNCGMFIKYCNHLIKFVFIKHVCLEYMPKRFFGKNASEAVVTIPTGRIFYILKINLEQISSRTFF